MAITYSDYSSDRIGWFFGLTGPQLLTLTVTSIPVFWAIINGVVALLGSGALALRPSARGYVAA